MIEHFGEKISQADIVESEAKKAPGLELARTSELDEVVSQVDQLAGDLESDRNIQIEKLIGLDEALGRLKVNFGAKGETMTIAELKKVLDIEHNTGIFREIEDGHFERISRLTYITQDIARILCKRRGLLHLANLTSISDEIAAIFGQKIGNGIVLWNLRNVSEAQIRSMCQNGRSIGLDRLENLTPNLARLLDEFDRNEQIDMSDSLKEKVEKLI